MSANNDLRIGIYITSLYLKFNSCHRYLCNYNIDSRGLSVFKILWPTVISNMHSVDIITPLFDSGGFAVHASVYI